MDVNLTAFPDSDEDALWDSHLGPLNVALARRLSGPLRELQPCDCGLGQVFHFVFRDAVQPRLVCGGAICTNPLCKILVVSLSTDRDAPSE
jgi:hypothetical protein